MVKILLLLALAALGWFWWSGRQARLRETAAVRRIVPEDEAQARAVLGVGDDAGVDQIRAAHRRLIARVHPDRGGSEELTRRVNLARDMLLKQLRD